MLSFATPLAFLLLLPWAAAVWFLYRTGRRTGVLFAATHRLPARTAGWRATAAALVPPLFLLGTLLLIIAAARPRTALSRARRSVNAIAIGMVVDVSGSMEALDLSPSQNEWKTRLEVVKETFAKFVEARPDDLIGLVTFGGYASTRAPLTADHRALVHVLKGVEIPRAQTDAQGRPIDKKRRSPRSATDSPPVSRVWSTPNPKRASLSCFPMANRTPASSRPSRPPTRPPSSVSVSTPSASARTPALLSRRATSLVARPSPTPTPPSTRRNLSPSHPKPPVATSACAITMGWAALDEINSLETTRIDREIYQRFDEHFVRYLLWGPPSWFCPHPQYASRGF